MTGFEPFETERLRIRRFRREDAVAFAAYRMDPEVARYQSWSDYTLEEAELFCAEMASCDPGVPGEWFQFALADPETNWLVGDVGVRFTEPAELGFTLARDRWGGGYAAEAVGAVIDRVRSRHGVGEVVALAHPRNSRSIRLLERLGFERAGEHGGDLRFVSQV